MIFSKRFTVRRFLAASMAVAAVAALAGGCSRQSEGERCSIDNGNEDCDSDLLCTQASDLQQGGDGVDRCCPPSGDPVSSSACAPRVGGGTGTGGSTGLGGGAGTGQGGGAAGEAGFGIGDECAYTSQCRSGLVCGPGGACQAECIADEDCPSARPKCSNRQECVATSP